jgi:hypothetical protein
MTNEHIVNIKHSASFFEACVFIQCDAEVIVDTHTHTHTHTTFRASDAACSSL